LRHAENAIVLITHYQRMLNYVTPDRVHVIHDGRIVRSGDRELALEIEERGYDWLAAEPAGSAAAEPAAAARSAESVASGAGR
jgi:Fe-S cluster assembly ATP-binding protein